MEGYNGSEQGTPETYMIQGVDSSFHFTTTSSLDPIQAMDNDGAQEFIVDQSMYYPAATNYYGYYCTGYESTGEWDDQNRFIGLDGSDFHYPGLQTESVPYVYYTPGYGYAQSPYNPYNPYIPGAIIGVDSSYVGIQQYYPGATYQQTAPSPSYYPLVVQQPSPDNVLNSAVEPHLLNTSTSNVNGSSGPGAKSNPPSASAGTAKISSRPASGGVKPELGDSAFSQSHSLGKRSEVPKASAAPKQPVARTSASGTVSHAATSQATQGRTASGPAQAADQSSLGQASSIRTPVRVSLPVTSGLPDFGSSAHRWSVDKARPRMHGGGVLNIGNGNPDFFGEQNRGPRTNRSRSQWASSVSVEINSTSGFTSAHGNIIIHADQYNKEDFSVDHANAKFFVIKSYSEDDVHKSIKYNVWSSTPNGNKRLDSAYEDSRRIAAGTPGGCPIFLFFSVNASGQFCGVAQMIGPVDFDKDMDFWQQDKWSGSFPVKWHIVKDVPNTNFRHIILENNENKPVTNSRDTQEIKYKPGMEMLNIFKNCMLKTSILDDFPYYEERQKILQEEKARLHGKSYSSTFFVPAFIPKKPDSTADQIPGANDLSTNHSNGSAGTIATTDVQVHSKLDAPNLTNNGEVNTKNNVIGDLNDVTSDLKIGCLSINSNQAEPTPSGAAVTLESTKAIDVVTVGSVPVKVNGLSEASCGILTIGTIPIASKALAQTKFTTGPPSGGGK